MMGPKSLFWRVVEVKPIITDFFFGRGGPSLLWLFWYLPYKILSGYLWILILFLGWQGGGHGHGQQDVGAPHDSGHCWLHNMSNIPPLTDMQAMQGWIISPELFTHCFYHKERECSMNGRWEGRWGGPLFQPLDIGKSSKLLNQAHCL